MKADLYTVDDGGTPEDDSDDIKHVKTEQLPSDLNNTWEGE